MKRRFLLLPKEINGKRRWLCKATWQEVYSYGIAGPLFDTFGDGWRATKWLDI